MKTHQSLKRPLAILIAALAVLLPCALVWSSYMSYRTQFDQRRVYLRSRIAAVAAQLESLPEPSSIAVREALLDEEPGLVDLIVILSPSPGDGLEALWQGRELFRVIETFSGSEPILRGILPFHDSAGLHLVRVDLAVRSADFLIQPARRSLVISFLAGFSILLLALLSAWAFDRSRRAEMRQAELEHLAHIGQLSAVLAHEIRNPLGTIKGYAQLLGEKLPSEHTAMLDPILTQSARLEQLVKDLLLYGRPPQPQFVPVPVDEIVAVLQAHAAHIDLPDHAIEIQSEATGSVVTDAGILEQALLNLLRNAAEAAGESGDPRVAVHFAHSGSGLRITLTDNGPGFTQEALDRLFQPFFTTKAFGTGLGLSTTRNLLRSIGASLAIQNQAEGGALAVVLVPGTKA